MVEKYLATQNDALQLLVVYRQFQSTKNIGPVNDAARRYCDDRFDDESNFVLPDDGGLEREVASACQQIVEEANRFNSKIAKQMFKQL